MRSRVAFDQGSLFGVEPRQATDKLFYALLPPADIARRTAEMAADLRVHNHLSKQPVAADRFHVTINHVGSYVGVPNGVLDSAMRAGAAVSATPFEVKFDYAQTFRGKPGNYPFVLRNDQPPAELMAFQQSLALEMMKAGLKLDTKFTPHMTLSYDSVQTERQPIERLSWMATEFVLVHSLIGQTRHIVLGRWPLL